MSCPREYDEDDDDLEPDDEASDHDPEGPSPDEMDSHDDPDLDACPHCRKLITEDAERCPHCGQYVSAEEAPLSKPMWVVIGVILALLVALVAWQF
jgi:hypothetical protein